jgi:1-acyl-sn-glycerol-3-phosphate acyltransferase
MEMTSHAWGVLKSGAITATVKVGAPVPLGDFKDRKDLALKSERAVRRDVLSILRGRMDGSLVPVEPSEAARRAKMVIPVRKSEKWT